MKKNKISYFILSILMVFFLVALFGCSKENISEIQIKNINIKDIASIESKYQIISLSQKAGGPYYLITVDDNTTNIKITNYILDPETQKETPDYSVYIADEVLSKSNSFVIQGVLDAPIDWHQYRMTIYGSKNAGIYEIGLSNDGESYIKLIDNDLK